MKRLLYDMQAQSEMTQMKDDICVLMFFGDVHDREQKGHQTVK